MTAPLHGLNFVAAALRKSGRTFSVSAPADGAPLEGKFHLARNVDAEEALAAAAARPALDPAGSPAIPYKDC